MTTTLKLYPNGLTAIEFGRDAAQNIGGYYVPTDTLDLNEAERVEILYAETKLGGSAVSKRANLVDITFTVFVIGTDRNDVLAKAHALNKAIMNPKGGKLEVKPHDASISTYYYYEASSPAPLMEMDRNKWDWEYPFYEGQHVVALEVSLKTKPYGASDVYETVLPSRTTLQNASYDVSYYNWFDLPPVKGDIPALFQLKVRNLQTGVDLSRIYLCTRSSVLSSLSNVIQTLQAEDGTQLSGTWTNTTSASYSGGAAKQISLGIANTYYGLRIPYTNESDHRGLVGVLVSGSFPSASAKIKVGYAINGTEVWRDTREFPVENTSMHLAYAGEHHIPPLALPDGEEISNPELLIFVKSPTLGTVVIDAVHLIFSDETVAQYDFGATRATGITYDQKFIIETNHSNTRVARVTTIAEDFEYYAASVVGSVFLEAADTTRVFLLFERVNGVYNPYDQVGVEVKVMYRTIYPFGS